MAQVHTPTASATVPTPTTTTANANANANANSIVVPTTVGTTSPHDDHLLTNDDDAIPPPPPPPPTRPTLIKIAHSSSSPSPSPSSPSLLLLHSPTNKTTTTNTNTNTTTILPTPVIATMQSQPGPSRPSLSPMLPPGHPDADDDNDLDDDQSPSLADTITTSDTPLDDQPKLKKVKVEVSIPPNNFSSSPSTSLALHPHDPIKSEVQIQVDPSTSSSSCPIIPTSDDPVTTQTSDVADAAVTAAATDVNNLKAEPQPFISPHKPELDHMNNNENSIMNDIQQPAAATAADPSSLDLQQVQRQQVQVQVQVQLPSHQLHNIQSNEIDENDPNADTLRSTTTPEPDTGDNVTDKVETQVVHHVVQQGEESRVDEPTETDIPNETGEIVKENDVTAPENGDPEGNVKKTEAEPDTEACTGTGTDIGADSDGGIAKSNRTEQKQKNEPQLSDNPDTPNANRPIPKHLPKVAKNRPENSRVFIGNLASEYTTSLEIVKVFHKYGTLIEEPVLRRSFGFVQYSHASAAYAAVKAEQGRIIGGIRIDLSIADNREVRKGAHIVNNTPFIHPKPNNNNGSSGGGGGSSNGGNSNGRSGRFRDRDHNPMMGGLNPQGYMNMNMNNNNNNNNGNNNNNNNNNNNMMGNPMNNNNNNNNNNQATKKRRRSPSPTTAKKGGVHPPQYRRQRPEPRNGIFLRILCMSPSAKSYARHCENTFHRITGSRADILPIVASGLGEALGRAMRDQIPYVMVVASKDVDEGTCTIRTLEKTGYEKSGRGNGVIPLQEAIEVCLIERGIIMPPHMRQQQQNQFGGGLGMNNGTGGMGLTGIGNNNAAGAPGLHPGMNGLDMNPAAVMGMNPGLNPMNPVNNNNGNNNGNSNNNLNNNNNNSNNNNNNNSSNNNNNNNGFPRPMAPPNQWMQPGMANADANGMDSGKPGWMGGPRMNVRMQAPGQNQGLLGGGAMGNHGNNPFNANYGLVGMGGASNGGVPTSAGPMSGQRQDMYGNNAGIMNGPFNSNQAQQQGQNQNQHPNQNQNQGAGAGNRQNFARGNNNFTPDGSATFGNGAFLANPQGPSNNSRIGAAMNNNGPAQDSEYDPAMAGGWQGQPQPRDMFGNNGGAGGNEGAPPFNDAQRFGYGMNDMSGGFGTDGGANAGGTGGANNNVGGFDGNGMYAGNAYTGVFPSGMQQQQQHQQDGHSRFQQQAANNNGQQFTAPADMGWNNGNGGMGRDAAAAAAAAHKATIDLGKVSNLIPLFQPQKQPGQPPDNRNNGNNARNNPNPMNATAPRIIPGNMSQILADPAVQQVLQNIGEAGRLGTAATAIQQQQGAAIPMPPGGMPAAMGMWNGGQQQQGQQQQQHQQNQQRNQQNQRQDGRGRAPPGRNMGQQQFFRG